MVHNSAVELASPLFRRKRKRGNTGSRSVVGVRLPFSIVGRRYSAGSSCRFSPFFSDRFERRGLVYVGASIQHKTASDAVFAEYDFTWDAGNRITEFETVDGTAEYTYDKTGQLTGADYDYITDELYTYDDNGNRTNAGYLTGENNETLSDGMYRYSYDNEGNRTEKFLWTDTNNDGIIDDSEKTLVQTYEWDYRNRLESVTNYENGIAKEVMDYLYDYLNLMIERTVTDAATSVLQSSEYNLYSNGQVVLEYDTTSSVDVVKSVNLWGANIDELVAVEQMAQSVSDNNIVLWSYGDHLNSIRDIVLYDSITQTTAVVNHLIYNAFGVLVSSTDGSTNNPISISPLLKYRYTGKFFDDSTGLQNNINRWYDNTTGKWLSVDPIGFNGGDENLYRYVGNQADSCSDYTGLYEFAKIYDYINNNINVSYIQRVFERVSSSLSQLMQPKGSKIVNTDFNFIKSERQLMLGRCGNFHEIKTYDLKFNPGRLYFSNIAWEIKRGIDFTNIFQAYTKVYASLTPYIDINLNFRITMETNCNTPKGEMRIVDVSGYGGAKIGVLAKLFGEAKLSIANNNLFNIMTQVYINGYIDIKFQMSYNNSNSTRYYAIASGIITGGLSARLNNQQLLPIYNFTVGTNTPQKVFETTITFSKY
ncbi:MAG: hypothetical protein IKX40_10875 [Thermoguttaceae bacterium]|nr:hypothetical protein [Thermoguttaceae bacterium]